MSSRSKTWPFSIKQHVIPCQHIREYARATARCQEDALFLAIKQYVPMDLTTEYPESRRVTIIAAAANGFPKELYEPLWEELHLQSKQHGFAIRAIWIADMAQQGASGFLNEKMLGDDPSWFDHSRDLLHMINHFRQEMPLPIVGVGHSAGANILANLAIMHPRLMTSLVMLEPTIQLGIQLETSETGPGLARASAGRRDVWTSRASAEVAFRSNILFRSWDHRVFELWLQYGLCESSRAADHCPGSELTLATTKHQECFTFVRPSWQGVNSSGLVFDSEAVPDLHPDSVIQYPFYRPEVATTFSNLPHLRPAVLYLFGGKSLMSQYDAREAKVAATGVGYGGSGGSEQKSGAMCSPRLWSFTCYGSTQCLRRKYSTVDGPTCASLSGAT